MLMSAANICLLYLGACLCCCCCQAICPLGLLPPLGGFVQYSQGGTGPFPEGTTAALVCQQGLPMAGQSISVCEGGIWQPSLLPACSLSLSPTGGQCLLGLGPVANGNVQYSVGSQLSGAYPAGTVARLLCLNGQLPVGSSVATCLGGLWQPGVLGFCPAAGLQGGGIGQQNCALGPATPLNGRIVYSNRGQLGPYSAGTVATLFCNLGYVPSGTTTSICQNGVFSPSLLGSCNLSTGK